MPILQYAKWQNFKKIIDKAMVACKNSKISIEDCFTDISKPIISGKGKQEISEKEYKLLTEDEKRFYQRDLKLFIKSNS